MNRCAGKRPAFTLIELLVALGTVGLLAGILMPAISATRHAARDLQCCTQLKSTCQAFTFFAEENYAGTRGDSDRFGDNRFRLEDFQESIYGISEFWDGPEAGRGPIEGTGKQLTCPSATGRIERRSRVPCSSGAVGPQKNVSVGFNRRLDTRTRYINGQPFPATAYLTPKILQYPDVPLILDVDGETAVEKGVRPYYTGPAIRKDGVVDIYETGDFWFPAMRHRGRLNVGFIGGHILPSTNPVTEAWFRWDFQPEP